MDHRVKLDPYRLVGGIDFSGLGSGQEYRYNLSTFDAQPQLTSEPGLLRRSTIFGTKPETAKLLTAFYTYKLFRQQPK